jgi:hypothetical protein
MNSHPIRRPHALTPSTKANARALAKLADSPRVPIMARIDNAPVRGSTKGPPNPLWVIAIAMGAFFGATALIMLV